MFGRRKSADDAVDVNDFIVNESMEQGAIIDPHLVGPSPNTDISNDQIIDAELANDVAPRRRVRLPQILILGAVTVFAVGGIASIFISAPMPPPAIDASTSSGRAVAPEVSDIKLPSGLTVANESSPGTQQPVASTQIPQSTVESQGAQESSAPAPITTQQSATAISTQPLPQAAAQPTEPANPISPSAPIANPISAQIVEAQKLSQATEQSNTRPPAAPPATPTAEGQKEALRSETTKPSSSIKSAERAEKQAAEKTEKRSLSQASTRTPVPPTSKSTERETMTEEGVKRLVTVSAEAFGLQSIHDGSVTLEGRRGNAPQSLRVGDRLPSGEQILRIDARTTTLVTDRSVIRFN